MEGNKWWGLDENAFDKWFLANRARQFLCSISQLFSASFFVPIFSRPRSFFSFHSQKMVNCPHLLRNRATDLKNVIRETSFEDTYFSLQLQVRRWWILLQKYLISELWSSQICYLRFRNAWLLFKPVAQIQIRAICQKFARQKRKETGRQCRIRNWRIEALANCMPFVTCHRWQAFTYLSLVFSLATFCYSCKNDFDCFGSFSRVEKNMFSWCIFWGQKRATVSESWIMAGCIYFMFNVLRLKQGSLLAILPFNPFKQFWTFFGAIRLWQPATRCFVWQKLTT